MCRGAIRSVITLFTRALACACSKVSFYNHKHGMVIFVIWWLTFMTGASVCDNQHCTIKCLLNCKMQKIFYNMSPYLVCVILIEQRIHMVIFSVSIDIR